MVKMTSEESKKRMHEGRLYLPEDEEIMHQQMLCLEKQYEYNLTRPSEGEKREALLKEMLSLKNKTVSELCSTENMVP